MKIEPGRTDPRPRASLRVLAPGGAWIVVVPVLLAFAFAAGRLSAPTAAGEGPAAPVAGLAAAGAWGSMPALAAERLAGLVGGVAGGPMVAPRAVQLRTPLDPRELIPMPGPGDGPGDGPGQAPGQAPAPGECLLMMPDGQLFRLEVPGPGDGPQPGNGGTPELFPLVPAPGPSAPAPPRPQGPPPGTLQM